MANVLKLQHSLDAAFRKRAVGGLLCSVIGVLTIIYFTQVVGLILVISGIVLIHDGIKFSVGAVGEKRVAKVLASFPDEWYIFNDMVVGHSQIDHVVISPGGVFTIETKNYRGTIYGNAEKQNWFQVINHHKTEFYNPVKQGNGHSIILRKFLELNGFKNVWVNTIVVFTEPHVELKVHSLKVPVLYLSELHDFLNQQRPVTSPEYSAKIAMCVSILVPVLGK